MTILRIDNVRSIRGWQDFETWTEQTTKPPKCAKKKPIDKKIFIFKVELLIFERLGLVCNCFLEHRDFDNPGSDDLMNGENELDEFRGLVGPEACRRTALGYAYNRLSVDTRSDTTVLYVNNIHRA